jgi:hypothetical protein
LRVLLGGLIGGLKRWLNRQHYRYIARRRLEMSIPKILWDSQSFAITLLFNRFDPPVIDGGQIYVPNYNGGVDLYRLAR